MSIFEISLKKLKVLIEYHKIYLYYLRILIEYHKTSLYWNPNSVHLLNDFRVKLIILYFSFFLFKY